MEANAASAAKVVGKTIVVHTVTYFIVGLLAFTLFDYTTRFSAGELSSFMRPTDDPLVAAGPLFQPVRGILFGIVFYLLREVFFAKKRGWLIMWTTLVFLGIFSTFGPTPGSIEGLIYTTLSPSLQLLGLAEVLLQSLCLAFVLHYWVTHAGKRWLSRVLVGLFLVALILPTLGLLAAGMA